MKKYILSTLFCLLSFSTFAATITVTFTTDEYTDNSDCSLREAITNANNDDSIAFDECVFTDAYGDDTITLEDGSTYYLSRQGSGEADNASGDLDITANLNITSDGEAFIDAGDLDTGGTGDPDRIFDFLNGTTFVISNMRLQDSDLNDNGTSGYNGGTVSNTAVGSTLTITNCRIQGNEISTTGAENIYGGGIYSFAANLIVQDSAINLNTLSKSVDASATSAKGGGIYFDGDDTYSFTLTDSELVANSISNAQKGVQGGAIYIRDALDITIDTNTVMLNTADASHATDAGATASGGGLVLDSNLAGTIINSTFIENSATSESSAAITRGGALYTTDSTLEIINSTFEANLSFGVYQSTGGAISSLVGTTDISFVTINGNIAGDATSTGFSRGGGVHSSSGTVNLIHSILSTNEVFSTFSTTGPNCGTSIVSLGNNVIDDTAGCTGVIGSDLESDPELVALTGNGGDTDTMEISDSSPALNLATDCTDVDGDDVTTDQRGAPRQDGACDAGAYELRTFYADADSDGEGDSTDLGSTPFDDGDVTNNTDCDDESDTINTSAPELCGDGQDNDCDSDTDEGFEDEGAACSVGVGACADTGTYECSVDLLSLECNAVEGTPSDELCGDSVDNNCDGDTDEGFEDLGEACAVGVGECANTGEYECSTDALSLECSVTAGGEAEEICDDDADNDCDGDTDADDADCTDSGDDDDDSDSDGIADSADNCPDDSNADQLDTDADGIGDECEVAASSSGGGCQLTTAPHVTVTPMALSVLGLAGLAAARLRRRLR